MKIKRENYPYPFISKDKIYFEIKAAYHIRVQKLNTVGEGPPCREYLPVMGDSFSYFLYSNVIDRRFSINHVLGDEG